MRVRPVAECDREAIRHIHKKQNKKYELPNPENGLFEVVVTDDEGFIVGYAITKLFLESTIVLDDDRPKFQRAKALKSMFNLTVAQAVKHKIQRLFAISDSLEFIETLQDHLGYKIAAGTTLFKELD